MKLLRERTHEEGMTFHAGIQPRNYYEDGVQQIRVIKSRDALSNSLTSGRNNMICELCCGTADISGPFADNHTVYAFDWFKMAGHEIVEQERFVIGGTYDIALARSRRV